MDRELSNLLIDVPVRSPLNRWERFRILYDSAHARKYLAVLEFKHISDTSSCIRWCS